MCGQIFWRSGTGGIFARTRPIFSLGRDAKMHPVPLLGGRWGRGVFSRHVLPRTQILFAKKPPVPSDWSARKSPPHTALAAHRPHNQLFAVGSVLKNFQEQIAGPFRCPAGVFVHAVLLGEVVVCKEKAVTARLRALVHR